MQAFQQSGDLCVCTVHRYVKLIGVKIHFIRAYHDFKTLLI
ncbi:hypothetical protein [Moraxella lacunata]